jgi:hypothetical protein
MKSIIALKKEIEMANKQVLHLSEGLFCWQGSCLEFDVTLIV